MMAGRARRDRTGRSRAPGTDQMPRYAYAHGGGTLEGFAITGGWRFTIPLVQLFPAEYSGDYFFADFVNDWINVLDVASGNVTRFATGAAGAVDLHVARDGARLSGPRHESGPARHVSDFVPLAQRGPARRCERGWPGLDDRRACS